MISRETNKIGVTSLLQNQYAWYFILPLQDRDSYGELPYLLNFFFECNYAHLICSRIYNNLVTIFGRSHARQISNTSLFI